MAKDAFGIIFSSLNENTLSRLTKERTVAAIPFACRYRLIDFSLSNMVNSGISNINIVANYNYRSLLSHIGSGKDFDLDRRNSGIKLITPFGIRIGSSSGIFKTRLEALRSMRYYLNEYTEEYAVLYDSDSILNIDLKAVIDFHEKNSAELTFVTGLVDQGFRSKNERMMLSSRDGAVNGIKMLDRYDSEHRELSLGILVMRTEYLRQIVLEASGEDESSLTKYLMKRYRSQRYFTYTVKEAYRTVGSFLDYYKASMDLLSDELFRASLLMKEGAPIYTRVNSSPPARYLVGSSVKNSLIADGCVIEGEVSCSVISRGVIIEKGAVVRNSVLFRGTRVERGASLSHIVTDKFVTVSRDAKLSGTGSMPFYVEKGRIV